MNKNQAKKYKLFLINPAQKHRHYVTQVGMSQMLGKVNSMPPLSLPTVASLTPDNYDIRIIDEQLESIPTNEKPDLVGITTLSSTYSRAFEIADYYKSLNIPVVLGGSYISYMVEEGLKHASSIVKGEAEGAWDKCLTDFERGEMNGVYEANPKTEFKTQPFPRWDLVDIDKFVSIGVQATRGCPFHCEFCLVSELFGHKMRFRDVDNVIDEINRLPVNKILFVDDNLTFNKKFARELMQKLKPLNITWVCQCSIDIADDDELLTQMAEAGCFQLLIGFESLNTSSLDETNKSQNKIAQYEAAIERIHSKGIHVLASFVVGFDHDYEEEFNHIFNFTQRNNLVYSMLSILECSPGTKLFFRLQEEGRWYGSRPGLGGGMTPNMHYMNFTQREIFDKYYETVQRLMSFENMGERAINLFSKGYFNRNRESKENMTIAFKFRVVMSILKAFVFSKDKVKKDLFKKLFKLFREKRLAVDELVIFLISIEGYNRHIASIIADKENFYEKIKQVDKGAWINQIKTKEATI